MRAFTVLLGAALIAGCVQLNTYTDPPMPLAAGERLRVTQTLQLPEDGSRLYLQHGEAGSARDYTVREHHCSLVVKTPGGVLPPVAAGTELVVANVQRKMDFGVWERGVTNYRTLIGLAPGAHPLRALECELWAYGYDVNSFITRSELRRALEPVLQLEGD